MATLLILKRRIQTAQNVSKTTRAMQMIAASKLKKAQEAALSSRPYVDKLTNITTGLSKKIDEENKNEFMIEKQEDKKDLFIVISPDKGLCGGLISNLSRAIIEASDKGRKPIFISVGKKAEGILRYFNKELIASFDFGTTLPSFSVVYPILDIVKKRFLEGDVTDVKIIGTNFKNVFSQVPEVMDFLPIKFNEESGEEVTNSLFEPDVESLIPYLSNHYIEMRLFQSLLESYLSEQSARMLAMQNATDNAKEVISELRLEYNKTRQEKITNEILDIAGGAFI